MTEQQWLAEQFAAHRDHLLRVAYRLLGSTAEADDAVQEAWLRVSRADAGDIDNVAGWLTTVVSRVCLDSLRSRTSRREEPLDAAPFVRDSSNDPEQDLLLADSVGVALVVMLNTLAPVERTTFVLHDMFALPFEEIATIIGRTPAATRQIASRARRRVRGPARVSADVPHQRHLVDTFVSALKAGDMNALLGVLDPDFVIRADASVAGRAMETRGAETWARNAMGFARLLQSVHPILVNGAPALVFAPKGRMVRVMTFAFHDGRITTADLIGDPSTLATLELSAPNPDFTRKTTMKIKLTTIYVDDQEKALHFYTDVLGFAKKADFSNGAYRWLTVTAPDDPEGVELQLAKNDSPHAAAYQRALYDQGQPAIMLFTDDAKADHARIVSRGGEFTMTPTDVTGSTIAQFNDTCGNRIQLTQLVRR